MTVKVKNFDLETFRQYIKTITDKELYKLNLLLMNEATTRLLENMETE